VRVLIAEEFSGRIREEFRKLGHDAWSCDWKWDTEIPGQHYRGDIRDILYDDWDLLIAHPDCTYLANSGVQHLHRTPANPSPGVLYGKKRQAAMREGAKFLKMHLDCDHIPLIAVENPIPHRYAIAAIGRKYTQIIQPYQFGDAEQKATCLWLKGLPPLVPTKLIPKHLRKQSVFLASPGPQRAHERSRTFLGIARAMAAQWGHMGTAIPQRRTA
jgi:hypothetical protein